jgi:hypothetical protein
VRLACHRLQEREQRTHLVRVSATFFTTLADGSLGFDIPPVMPLADADGGDVALFSEVSSGVGRPRRH